MARENRFKKNLDKDKAKEIVSANPTDIIVDDSTNIDIDTTNTDSNINNDSTNTDENTNQDANNNAGNDNKTSPTSKALVNDKVQNYTKLGVNVREDLRDKVDALGKRSNNMKANDVVVKVLENIFDDKKFTVSFDKKSNTKVTSYNLPTAMDKAITKIKDKTGYTKSEIFNKLLEEALKEYFD